MAGMNPQMVIRIAADVTELRRNLAEGKASIEALGPSVANLTGTWSKHSANLIQDARNITAAVAQVGAATLTTADSASALKKLDAAMAQLRTSGQPIPALMTQTADSLRAMHPELSRVATKSGEASAGITELAGAFGIMLGAAGAIAMLREFIGSVADFGEEIERAAVKTGMTTGEVQKLGYIAQQTGTEAGVMTSAVQMLEQRLGTENSGAVGAMARLGINTEAFLALDPYQEMRALAVAMAQVPDPTERAALAFQLFGKSWKEVMPAMLGDFDALAERAPMMSAAQVEALANAGHAWEGFKTTVKVAAAGAWDSASEFVANVVAALDKGENAVTSFEKIWLGLRGDMVTPLPTLPSAPNVGGAFNVAMTADEAAVVAKKLKDSAEALIEVNKAAEKAAALALKSLNEQDAMWTKLTADIKFVGDAEDRVLNDWGKEVVAKGRIAAETWAINWDEQQKSVSASDKEYLKLRAAASKTWIDNEKQKVQDWADAWLKGQKQAAADTKKNLATAAQAFDDLGRVAEMAGHQSMAAIAGIASATIKAFATGGPWAAAMAGAMATITAFADKLFKTEGKQVNDLRDAFVAAQGGNLVLNEALREAGRLDLILEMQRASSMAEWTKALADINAALDAQKTKMQTVADLQKQLDAAIAASIPSWDTINGLMTKYNISLDSAGLAVEQLNENANATTLLNDWQTWAAAGGSLNAMIVGMSGNVSKLVQDALAFGTTIPENLKDLVGLIASNGLLLDSAGNTITDLSKLSWGSAIQTDTDKNTIAINTLTDSLNALNATLQMVTVAGASPGTAGGIPASSASRQAAGGDYWVTRPTLFLAGESGPERATFAPASGGTGGASAGPGATSLVVQLVSQDGRLLDEHIVSTTQLAAAQGRLRIPARAVIARVG